MQATAAVLRSGEAPYELVEIELDDPGPGEVLVELVATGYCHTDTGMRASFRNTPFPAVLGHEGAGRIAAVGAGVDMVIGQPVVLSYRSCRSCRNCNLGASTYCDNMMPLNFALSREDGTTAFRLDGQPVGSHFFGQSSFATHTIADARSVVPVGDDDPLDIIGPLGCGVQTGAGAVLNNLRPWVGSSFAVLGSGSVGLSALLAAVYIGCDTVIAVDRHPGRLAFARELGATHTIDTSADGMELGEALLAATGGRGVDRCFDTTGLGEVVGSAMHGLAVNGTLGTVAAGEAALTEVSLRQLLPGRTLTGILEGDSMPQVFIPELLSLHRAGKLPFDQLISQFPFAQINEAEQASNDGSVIKPVLLMP